MLAADGRACDGTYHYMVYLVHGAGYVLLLCSDVNECMLGSDSCEHNCSNTVGSYTCSCNSGYTLNRDGHTCDGRYS